jgi:peptidoglycan/xylan/chitin deacetylase (PgdA/CDA1 family)
MMRRLTRRTLTPRHQRAASPLLARRSARRVGLALVYHRIGDPAGDPRYELVPALGTRLFEAQLDHLRSRYRIVPPSRLLEAARARRPGARFPVAITFDDDLLSHADVVAPALLRARIAAGFFLTGSRLDGPRSFWWDDLQSLVDRRDAIRGLRSLPELDLALALQGRPRAVHEAAAAIERLPPDRRDAVADELRLRAGDGGEVFGPREIGALAAAGFEIGFHTLGHYLLPTLGDAALSEALTDGRERLEAVVGRPVTMIAYPHGKADHRVAAAARAAGYELGFTAWAQPAGPHADPLMIGRLEPTAASVVDFARAVAATLARTTS